MKTIKTPKSTNEAPTIDIKSFSIHHILGVDLEIKRLNTAFYKRKLNIARTKDVITKTIRSTNGWQQIPLDPD